MEYRNDGQSKAQRRTTHMMSGQQKIARALLVLFTMLVLLLPSGVPVAMASPALGGPTQADSTPSATGSTVAPAAAAPAGGGQAAATTGSSSGDVLYVGDGSDSSVRRFDAQTGAYLGMFVPSNGGGLNGPRGMIVKAGSLFVVNQNAGTPYNGDVLQFTISTGAFVKALLPCNASGCDPNAPWNPRGVIGGPDGTIYVADLGEPGDPTVPGKILQIDTRSGALVAKFDASGFTGEFRPRGLVMGPDGMLYAAVVGNLNAGDGFTGYVLRFDPRSRKFREVVIADPATSPASGCAGSLHRPEGLVFGPDGKLYVTSFRADASDIDRILIFDVQKRTCVGQIALDQAGQDRAYAQALLFGPGGDLFVPITNEGLANQFTAAVRRYKVTRPGVPYTNFVLPAAQGGALADPWYLTFGKTDASTLKYGN